MRILDGCGMPVEWDLSIVVRIFKGRLASGTAAATKLRSVLSME